MAFSDLLSAASRYTPPPCTGPSRPALPPHKGPSLSLPSPPPPLALSLRRPLRAGTLAHNPAHRPRTTPSPPHAGMRHRASIPRDGQRPHSLEAPRGRQTLGTLRVSARAAASAAAPEAAVSPSTMSELKQYLERELPRLFTPGGMQISGKFEDVVEFEDPITRYDSLSGYLFNIAMLRALFSPLFQLHSVYQSGPAELTTRWTMKMYFRLLPWQPELVFTGLSIYGINPQSGKFKSHKDVWDSIEDNAYFSREGLVDLLQQCARLYRKPDDAGAPPFDVLLRRANYEVRQYKPFTAAETAWRQGDRTLGQLAGSPESQLLKQWAEKSGVTLGVPFLWLVLGAGAPGEGASVVLRRPIHGSSSPTPDSAGDSTVQVVSVPPQAVAVHPFPGTPTAQQFEATESLLRASLLKDKLVPALPPGSYSAASYSEGAPLLVPALQRNEVLLPLQGLEWP